MIFIWHPKAVLRHLGLWQELDRFEPASKYTGYAHQISSAGADQDAVYLGGVVSHSRQK